MLLFDAVSVEKKHLDRGGHEGRGSDRPRRPLEEYTSFKATLL